MQALLALAVVGVLTGCGGSAADSAATSLRITVWPRGEDAGESSTWTLDCDPAGGTHPQAQEVCARLAALEEPFAPVPEDAICTQQYGGPTEAQVVGEYEGRPVETRFHRRDGCHIARWQKHAFLFPVQPVSP